MNTERLKQAAQEGAFAFVAFFLTGFASFAWGPANIPDFSTAKAALAGLVVGAIGAAGKAVLWYWTGTQA